MRNWANSPSLRSWARQSNSSAQYSIKFRSHSRSVPCDHGAPGALSGQRVFRMRVLRSERTCSATVTLKGSIRNLGLFVSKRDRFQLSILESSPKASRWEKRKGLAVRFQMSYLFD